MGKMTRQERLEAGARGEACDSYLDSGHVHHRCRWCAMRKEMHDTEDPTPDPAHQKGGQP